MAIMLDHPRQSLYKREKTFHKMEKGDIGIHEKAHKQDTSQTQQPHFTIVTSAPTSPFNTNHIQPLHLTFKTKYSCFSPNHSTPIPNRNVTILTLTKSPSKYNIILYACTNENYLIPSVPILPHSTPQNRIIPHITSCVDSGRCDGVIL